jgi:hypothetical protein
MELIGTRWQRGLLVALGLAVAVLTLWAFTAYQAPSFAFGLANLLTLCGF